MYPHLQFIEKIRYTLVIPHLVSGLEHDFLFSIQLGMSSTQLAFTHTFQRGRAQPPTTNQSQYYPYKTIVNQYYPYVYIYIYICLSLFVCKYNMYIYIYIYIYMYGHHFNHQPAIDFDNFPKSLHGLWGSPSRTSYMTCRCIGPRNPPRTHWTMRASEVTSSSAQGLGAI